MVAIVNMVMAALVMAVSFCMLYGGMSIIVRIITLLRFILGICGRN